MVAPKGKRRHAFTDYCSRVTDSDPDRSYSRPYRGISKCHASFCVAWPRSLRL
jgi:hypothetical protein